MNRENIDKVRDGLYHAGNTLIFLPPDPWPEEIRKALILITFSILGTYTRLGLTDLTNYAGSYVQGPNVLWPNFTACACMGLVQGLNKYKIIPSSLFGGLTTGYAGTASSFSSLMMELFNHSTAQYSANISMDIKFPNRAYGILEFLSVLTVELGVSICGLVLGYHVAKELGKYMEEEKGMPSELSINISSFLDGVEAAVIALALPFLIVQVVLAAVYSNFSRGWTLSAVFGIFGTLARYYISRWYNIIYPHFPLGTFTVNVGASMLLAVFQLLIRGKLSDGTMIIKSVNTSRVVGALGTGLCGAMSTISTFVNEGYQLPLRPVSLYYFVSIFISYSLFIVILGSYAWTRGLTDPIS